MNKTYTADRRGPKQIDRTLKWQCTIQAELTNGFGFNIERILKAKQDITSNLYWLQVS